MTCGRQDRKRRNMALQLNASSSDYCAEPPECESGECVDSSRPGRLNDFWVHILLHSIYSTLAGIWSGLNITRISGSVRSVNGAGQ